MENCVKLLFGVCRKGPRWINIIISYKPLSFCNVKIKIKEFLCESLSKYKHFTLCLLKLTLYVCR